MCVKTIAQWREYVYTRDLPKLGNGVSRTVYALDSKHVLKLANGSFDQCDTEIERWLAASPSERAAFATIHAYGEGWIIMERADCTLPYDDDNRVLCDLYEAITGVYDLYPPNIGVFGNSHKIIDYGYG